MEKKESEKKVNPLEELKKIGIEKIAEDTHILPSDIEAIIKKEFSKLNRTKALGFIKILEREYKLDLSDWRREYQDFITSNQQEDYSHIFVTVQEDNEEEKENKLFLIIGIVALIIIAYGTYYFFNSVLGESTVTEKKTETKIEEKKDSYETKSSYTKPKESEKTPSNTEPKALVSPDVNETNATESNESGENNETAASLTDDKEKNATEERNATVPSDFIIEPRAKVWAGIIFLDDYSKKQFLTDQNISLDPSKNFLIITGHGKINIYIGEEKRSFDEGRKLYLLYKDGSLERIDSETFKTINRGKPW